VKTRLAALSVVLATALFATPSFAQLPVEANANHEAMLASADPHLAANKRLVYDFWREILEAGHMDLAEKYMAVDYKQHNPGVPTGRAGFVEFFSKMSKPEAIQPKIQEPLVAIVAEGDLVVLSFVSEKKDPKDATKNYTTTWFDMFRVENGKVAEHWDPATKH
jgi:predicted SnoaL-like aldol condensation-catalyzing enzyme